MFKPLPSLPVFRFPLLPRRPLRHAAVVGLCALSLVSVSCGPNPAATSDTPAQQPSVAPSPVGIQPEGTVQVNTSQLQPQSGAVVTEIQESAQEIEIPLPADAGANTATAKITVPEKTFIGGGKIEAQILSHPDLAAAIAVDVVGESLQRPLLIELPLQRPASPGSLFQVQGLNPETGEMRPLSQSADGFPHLAVASADGRHVQFRIDPPDANFQTQDDREQFRKDLEKIYAIKLEDLTSPKNYEQIGEAIIVSMMKDYLLDELQVEKLSPLFKANNTAQKMMSMAEKIRNVVNKSEGMTYADRVNASCTLLEAVAGVHVPLGTSEACRGVTKIEELIGKNYNYLNPYTTSVSIDLGFQARVSLQQIDSPYPDTGNETPAGNVLFDGKKGLPTGKPIQIQYVNCFSEASHTANNWWDYFNPLMYTNPTASSYSCQARFGDETGSANLIRAGFYRVNVDPLPEAGFIEIARRQQTLKNLKHPKALSPVRSYAQPRKFTIFVDISGNRHRAFKLSDYTSVPTTYTAEEIVKQMNRQEELEAERIDLTLIAPADYRVGTALRINRGEYINVEMEASRYLEGGRYELFVKNGNQVVVPHKVVSGTRMSYSIGSAQLKTGSQHLFAELYDKQKGTSVAFKDLWVNILGPEEQQQQQTSSGGGGGGGGGGGSYTPPANRAPGTPTCNNCPDYALVGQSKSFSFGLSDPDSGESLSAEIDWGDGSGVQTLNRSGNGPVSTSHTYGSPGSYTLQVTAKDDEGLSSAVLSRSITIDSTHNDVDLTIE